MFEDKDILKISFPVAGNNLNVNLDSAYTKGGSVVLGEAELIITSDLGGHKIGKAPQIAQYLQGESVLKEASVVKIDGDTTEAKHERDKARREGKYTLQVKGSEVIVGLPELPPSKLGALMDDVETALKAINPYKDLGFPAPKGQSPVQATTKPETIAMVSMEDLQTILANNPELLAAARGKAVEVPSTQVKRPATER